MYIIHSMTGNQETANSIFPLISGAHFLSMYYEYALVLTHLPLSVTSSNHDPFWVWSAIELVALNFDLEYSRSIKVVHNIALTNPGRHTDIDLENNFLKF